MANKKLDTLVFSIAKNKDEIVRAAVDTLNSRESNNPDNKYITQVTHIHKDGENAGKQYFIISDSLKNEKGLDSNLIDINLGLSTEEVQALIAKAQLNNTDTNALQTLITRELAKNPTNITEERIQELINQSISSNITEQRVQELIAESVSSKVSEVKVTELINESISSKVDEAEVNKLIDKKLLNSNIKVVTVENDGVIDISKGLYFRLDMQQSLTLQLKNEPSSQTQPVYSFLLEVLNGDKHALTWFEGVSWSKGLLPSFENNRCSLFAFIVTDSIIGINVSKELNIQPRLRKERAND